MNNETMVRELLDRIEMLSRDYGRFDEREHEHKHLISSLQNRVNELTEQLGNAKKEIADSGRYLSDKHHVQFQEFIADLVEYVLAPESRKGDLRPPLIRLYRELTGCSLDIAIQYICSI